MLVFKSFYSEVRDIVQPYLTEKRVRILKADCTWRPHLFNIFCFNFNCCQDLFALNLFSSWITSLKLLRTQWLKIFRGRSCLLPVDMNAPESTFVNHCGKFVMFLVHILCLCFLFSSALFRFHDSNNFCLRPTSAISLHAQAQFHTKYPLLDSQSDREFTFSYAILLEITFPRLVWSYISR